MTTSTPESDFNVGGAFADGLTLTRFILTPIIMFVIIKGGWPEIDPAVLASLLFAIAAFTDLIDDKVGGGEGNKGRAFGWFDDIADTLLITGTLAAIFWVQKTSGSVTWMFAVPALAIITRDVLIALLKGGAYKQTGWPETRFGTLKTGLCLLAVCLLVSEPWLSNWAGNLLNGSDSLAVVYEAPWVEHIGIGFLWIAAIMSVINGVSLLTGKSSKVANDV